MLNKTRPSQALRGLLRCSLVVLTTIAPHAAYADATSTLVVTIKPQRAVDDGAKWRYVANGTPSQWFASGHKVTGLDDGDLVIEGSQPQQGPCKAPAKDMIEIRPGRPHIRELDYTSASCK